MKTNTKETLVSTRPPQEAKNKKGGKNNRFYPIVFLLLLSLSTKAHAFQLVVHGWNSEAIGSSLAPMLAQTIFLFILFIAVRYCAKLVGINFPECILPKKQVKTNNGDTLLFGRGSFFDFIRYTIYYVFKYFWKAFYYTAILPIAFAMRKIFQYHRPEGFMKIGKRLLLINSFRRGLTINGLWDRISKKISFENLILVARIGGGKSSSFIIPNILKLNNCSILCTDLSGELYRKTSGYMARRGYDIKIINPIKLDISNRYNPLASVTTYKEILDVSTILINAGDPNPKDPFWNNGAKKLLEILITALVNQREIRKAKNIQDYDKYCNLANLKFLLNSFGRDSHHLESFIKKYSVDKDGIVQNNYKEWRGFTSGNKKTTQSFLTTAQTALRIVGNDDFAKLTSSNEIDLNNIRKRKTIVYLQIPQEDLEVYGFLLNLFYSRFFATCFKSNDKKALPVYCLLDEAGHTNIPSLATTITTIRKYRVSISLILQSLSQLETAYGQSQANTILNGGVANQIYFSGLDLETCQRLEKIMGDVYDIEADKEKNTAKIIKKPLMDAQSIMRMKDRQAIYLYANQKPTLLRLTPYFKNFLLNSYSKLPEYIPNFYHRVDKVEYINFDDGTMKAEKQEPAQKRKALRDLTQVPQFLIDKSKKKEEKVRKENLAKDTQLLIDTFIAKFTYIHYTKTCQEKLNQEKFPLKKKVKSLLDLPNYFDKSKYIKEEVKYDIAKIIDKTFDDIKHPVSYTQECKKKYKPHDITRCNTVDMLPGETYTQFCKRRKGL